MEQIPSRKLIRRSVIMSNAVPIKGVLATFSTTCTGTVRPIQSVKNIGGQKNERAKIWEGKKIASLLYQVRWRSH